MRNVQAYDLELFAINTGELYETHKRLGRTNSLVDWIGHVQNRVRPLYCSQVERVALDSETAEKVAKGLQDYYSRHVRELDND